MLLNVRDPTKWYDSVKDAIYRYVYVLKIGWISEFFLVIDNNQLPKFDEARLLEVVFFFILFPLLLCFLSFNVTKLSLDALYI